jgi:hypothetical protein
MVSCGAPASQTHIGIVAGSGHEFYTKYVGAKGFGSRAREDRDRVAASASEL